MVGISVGGDDGNFGNADYARAVAFGTLADACLVREFLDQGVSPSAGSIECMLWGAVDAVGEELGVFDAAALQAHLEPVGAGAWQVDPGDGVVRVWVVSGWWHKYSAKDAIGRVGVQAGRVMEVSCLRACAVA